MADYGLSEISASSNSGEDDAIPNNICDVLPSNNRTDEETAQNDYVGLFDIVPCVIPGDNFNVVPEILNYDDQVSGFLLSKKYKNIMENYK